MAVKNVTLTIEGTEVTVPQGTLLVDAAKRAGIDVPVFCYHPKMDPVGMCRVCLVEIGRPARDRASGEPVLDAEGQPVIEYGRNPETACTMPVGEGWQVRVYSDKAVEGRKEIVEYLLTSHPLDCPICDKGGECPLQNLTMAHGPGVSRFIYDDKIKLAKHLPLGELIYLDRERCIQCARCTRFQDEVVDDPVIGFYQRGRRLEIVTFSDPGFDSYFSGNTTDICPVGALTTADFRFEARPWELNSAASICPHCPVGCNLTLNTRREARAGGAETIKRVMPRQNEQVNEIWICDKGRFAHHYAHSPERLSRPLVRENRELVETDWDSALDKAAELLGGAKDGLVSLVSGRLANEDLFNIRQLTQKLGGKLVLADGMAGGDLVQQHGPAVGTNLGDLGNRDAVLVIASDLHEQAPVWWLRLKQAAERGASLLVANARETRLDKHAAHVLRYPYGEAVDTALGLLHVATGQKDLSKYAEGRELQAAGRLLKRARNLLIFYGDEGLDYRGSSALARACANLLAGTGHYGKPNNGLIAVWPNANTQGAWDMGFKPLASGVSAALGGVSVAYLAGVDPLGDDPALREQLERLDGLVVQELYRTPTAEISDLVLPVQSFVEREGSYTSGERRVQRFYPAIRETAEVRPDWQIAAGIAERLEIDLEGIAASLVFDQLASTLPDYRGLSYAALSMVESQWPEVGGEDLYFGGTAYLNRQGLGVQLEPRSPGQAPKWTRPPRLSVDGDLILVPISRLYDHATTMLQTELLAARRAVLRVAIHPADAEQAGISGRKQIELAWDGRVERLELELSEHVPRGAALVPLNSGLTIRQPVGVTVK